MPRTKPKPSPPPAGNGSTGEILTLNEAAAYLRMPEADVLRLVDEQGLPARRLAKEWRFLKTAIQDWLRTGPSPKPGKEAQLAVAGSWQDDPLAEEELKEIHRRRGRPGAEEKS